MYLEEKIGRLDNQKFFTFKKNQYKNMITPIGIILNFFKDIIMLISTYLKNIIFINFLRTKENPMNNILNKDKTKKRFKICNFYNLIFLPGKLYILLINNINYCSCLMGREINLLKMKGAEGE